MSFVLNDAQRYFELKLFECGREQTIPNKVFAFTPKDYYVVHIVIAGQGVFATDNRVYKLKKGDLFFIGPHEHPHYYPDKKDPWLYLWLGFGGLHAAHYLHEAGISSDSPIIQDDHDGKLRMFLEQIYDCYTEHGFLDLNALGLTYQFMAALIHQKHNAATLSIKHRHFNRAKEYIYNNFAFDIKVSDIAGNVGITPNYLSKGDRIVEPGLLGRTVYLIKGNKIVEHGFFGKTVFILDKKFKIEATIDNKNGTETNATQQEEQIPTKNDTLYHKQQELAKKAAEESLEKIREEFDLEMGFIPEWKSDKPVDVKVPLKYHKIKAIPPAIRIKTLFIHAGVSSINFKGVHLGCAEKIVVDEGNPNFSTDIDGNFYNGNKTTLYYISDKDSLGAVWQIPETVTELYDNLFFGATSLVKIFIPRTLTKIGYNVFKGCKNLTIYTEYDSIPQGWSDSFNPDNRSIIFNQNTL